MEVKGYKETPKFISYYNPEEEHEEQDLLDYTFSQLRLRLREDIKLFTTPSMIFANKYVKNLNSDIVTSASICLIDNILTTTIVPAGTKEIVSETILKTLANSLGLLISHEKYIPVQLIALLYWLLRQKDHIPLIVGLKTIEEKNYYAIGIIQIPQDLIISSV